jgi:hypothetical protein
MRALEAVEAKVKRVLAERAATLQSWREPLPSQGNRVKNFENWVLLELVHKLRVAGADPIRTNGFFPGWRPSYWNDSHRFRPLQRYLVKNKLDGPKANVKSISPDLSFFWPRRRIPLNVEIKTQMSPKEILTDMAIAGFHNSHETRKAYQTAFLWVLLEPELEPFRRRFRQSLVKTQMRAKSQFGVRLELKPVGKDTGISFCLIRPRLVHLPRRGL